MVVRYELPLDDTLAMLRAYGWDSDVELYILEAHHVLALLDRFLAGELSPSQVQQWAELIEMRDDLGIDPGTSDLLRRIVFRLANPELNGSITQDLAIEIQALLKEAR